MITQKWANFKHFSDEFCLVYPPAGYGSQRRLFQAGAC